MSRRRQRWSRIVMCAALLVGCGDDDGDDQTQASAGCAAQTTPDPTSTSTSTPDGGPGAAPVAEPVVNEEFPCCVYWGGEIIARSDARTQRQIREAFATSVAPGEPPVAGAPVELGGEGALQSGLGVYPVTNIDPLAASELLAQRGVSASPNYVHTFSPGIKYAPFDAAVPVDATVQEVQPLQPVAASVADPVIAVLDTGYARVSTSKARIIEDATSGELMTGAAAGHGTFIVNILADLLPNARFVVAAVEANAARPPGGRLPQHVAEATLDSAVGPVPVRGDDDVVLALTRSLTGRLDYLNLSFGTYGCAGKRNEGELSFRESAFPEGETEPEAADEQRPELFDFRQPYGLRLALAALRRTSPDVQIFAAAGNDFLVWRDDGDPVFFPAGWAVPGDQSSFLHSVASDPKNALREPVDPAVPRPQGQPDTGDYSNWGPWVETQAKGTFAVSLLPAGTSWQPGTEGRYSWSGTSFATPCALALHAAGRDWDRDAGSAESDDFADCANTLLNAVPAQE